MKAHIVVRNDYPMEAFLEYTKASEFVQDCKIEGLAIVSIPLQADLSIECDKNPRLQRGFQDITGYFPDGTSSGILPHCPIHFLQPITV